MTTAAAARDAVWEHWDRLRSVMRRQFPGDETLAEEALTFVFQSLEEDDWARVRAWQGQGRLVSYLMTLATRLAIDFHRKRHGHLREPAWLASKRDPVWHAAYRLLIVERYMRHEVVEMLRLNDPHRETAFLDEVVAEVQAGCRDHAGRGMRGLPMEAVAEPQAEQPAPEEGIDPGRLELMDALRRCLAGPGGEDAPPTEAVAELASRIAPYVRLSDEDRLLLKMRFVDGIKIRDAHAMLRLEGDPYKRLARVIESLRKALRQAGVTFPDSAAR